MENSIAFSLFSIQSASIVYLFYRNRGLERAVRELRVTNKEMHGAYIDVMSYEEQISAKNAELNELNRRLVQANEETQYHVDLLSAQARELELSNTHLSEANEEIERQMVILSEQSKEIELANNVLAEKNEALETLSREKSEILGIVAHDLKNPLSAIIGLSDMMRDAAYTLATDEYRAFSQNIYESADRMLSFIKRVLAANAIETGKFGLVILPLEPQSLVSLAVEEYAAQAQAKNLTFHVSSTLMPNDAMLADEVFFKQTLDNLISNAVKYSPTGKTIYVSTTKRRDPINNDIWIRLTVRDEGLGLTEEDKTRLFGQFAKLSAKPTAGEHSTGLGLSIVKRIVQAMNGKVWCESERDKGIAGATFIVELPASVLPQGRRPMRPSSPFIN